MTYSFSLPTSLLELIEESELTLQEIMHPAIANGLTALEKALLDPPTDQFKVSRYDEYSGYQQLWKGSTRYTLKKTELPIPRRFCTRTIRITTECSRREIDHRQLYWTTLIKPYIPKGTTQYHKEKIQSNQLPPRSMTTLLALCLWSHMLQYQNRPEEQTTLRRTG
ncbi:MAG: hypothetical protein KAT70_09790 [Thermoplasmata archaeon]|nr:hypothetical protein [Thermoplasmata archaeon]